MIRTKACKCCGEVTFNINPSLENIEFVCENCKSIDLIFLGRYTTIKNKCDCCSNSSFKLKVHDINNKEHTKIECTKCQTEPITYFTDIKGVEIDRVTREMLIIQDNIKSVNERVNILDNKIQTIETNLKYTNENLIDKLSIKINENRIDINSINYEVNNFSDDINNLKSTLENIERSIVSSLYLFK